ncbi:MAG TPA: DDE-type integrase/transposase/recombinase [Actinomycetota bacterium]|nr:DDE-type integrase/transposase/recombinase [Actinomycetota bacterium]
MGERKAVTKQVLARYEAASKKDKGKILDELCALTGWNRDHARKALRKAREKQTPRKAPRRARLYGKDVLVPLRKIWATLDAPSGKRLAPFMREVVEAMERAGELRLELAVRERLLAVSAATIDRMLAADRRRLQVKGRSGTKPGSLLRRQIPIRTFAEWDEARPGFCEVDLVAHDGGDARGEYCQTLTLTDVASGWTECRALRNKAHRWVKEALAEVASELPFPLLGLDSDNGSEFINHLLFGWCTEQEVTFTRSRPWRKNDNCFVEQKNWAVVRRTVGYLRHDTPAELRVLEQIYRLCSLYGNFFQPQMKLVEKTRRGAKVSRRYDTPRTPYRRLMTSPWVPAETKHGLTRIYEGLNPVALKREITSLQGRLLRLANRRKPPSRANPDAHPWRNYRPQGYGARSPLAGIPDEAMNRRSRAS